MYWSNQLFPANLVLCSSKFFILNMEGGKVFVHRSLPSVSGFTYEPELAINLVCLERTTHSAHAFLDFGLVYRCHAEVSFMRNCAHEQVLLYPVLVLLALLWQQLGIMTLEGNT